MNKDLILEGNKMIAEFMGWKFIYKGKDYKVWNPDFKSEEEPPNDWVFATWIKDDFEEYMSRTLRYNLSWDWLMPVVEKIIQMPDTHITALNWLIKVEGDISQPVNYQVTSMRYLKRKDATFIGAYYFVVIEFIKWHNQKAQLSEPKVD